MAKKLKGKQKENGRQQLAEASSAFPPPPPPPPPGQLPTIPEQIRALPKLNTNVGHAAHAVASGSQPANAWGGAGQEEPKYLSVRRYVEEEDEEDEEEADHWGQHDDQWGANGTVAHMSPAMGASPAAGWGRDLPAGGRGPANLAAAITSAFGAAPSPKKGTLQEQPSGAPTPPAARHVAFGAASQLPPGARLQGPGHQSHHSSPQQAERPMHGRNQSVAGFASGWGAPERSPLGFAGPPNPAGPAWPQPEHFARSQPTPATAPAHTRPAATLPTGAWTQWGREPKFGMPQVATTITTSIPMAPPPPPPPQAQPPAVAAAAVVAPANALLQQAAMRQAQLQATINQHPHGQPRNIVLGQNFPGLHPRHPPAPAEEPTPVWPQQQEKKSWKEWAKAHQEHGAVGMHGNPLRPEQGRHAENMGAGTGYGAPTDAWGNHVDDGNWGGGGDDDAWQHDNYDDDDAAWAQPTKGKDRKRGHGHHRSDHREDHRQTQANGHWGGQNSPHAGGGYGQPQHDTGWPSPQGAAGAWGSSQPMNGAGKSPKGHSRWDAIAEEEEEEEEYDEEEEEEEEEYDDLEDMYLDPRDDRKRKTNSGISYQYQAPAERLEPTLPPAAHPPGPVPGTPQYNTFASFGKIDPYAPTTPHPEHSRTMNIATGRMATSFELSPPRRGVEETSVVESHGEALKAATPALFNSRRRLARERIHWGFSPDKDARVASLLRYIDAKAAELATIGVAKFLETGQRGALFANADFRVSVFDGAPEQPAFDWLTLQQIQPTMDRILQESVVCYKPMLQVVVFVFLLSKSGSSMAVWRRKLPVPEHVRRNQGDDLADLIAELPEQKVVYVDEMPPDVHEPPPPPPPKKRGFWRRVFGIFKRKPKNKNK